MFARLLEHKQWDWFRRQQCGVNDQRLGCTVKLSGLIDGEREGLRHRQPIMILRWCIARVVEQSRRRDFKSTAVVDQGHFEPLAIGGRLLVRERQAAQRLRQSLGCRTLACSAGTGDQVIGADVVWPVGISTGVATPRQARAFEVTRTFACPPRGR